MYFYFKSFSAKFCKVNSDIYDKKIGPTLCFLYEKCCQKTLVSYGNHKIPQSYKKSDLHIYKIGHSVRLTIMGGNDIYVIMVIYYSFNEMSAIGVQINFSQKMRYFLWDMIGMVYWVGEHLK